MECNWLIVGGIGLLCFLMGAALGYLLGRVEALEARAKEPAPQEEPPAAAPPLDPRLTRQLENLLRYDGSERGQRGWEEESR